MPYDLSQYLVIGISSRALFDLNYEDHIFQTQGLEAYCQYQLANESTVLNRGTAFSLIKAILGLNNLIPGKRKVEVIVMSRNNADTSLRIFNSIRHYGLDITRAALSGGQSLEPYLGAFNVDLFLSASKEDVRRALDSGFAAGLIYSVPEVEQSEIDQIRIAFDGDAVLFSEESEKIYKTLGLDEFLRHEKENANKPLAEGPFAKLLKSLAFLQHDLQMSPPPIRTALVTARNSPAEERVIKTLRAWGVRVDEAFFLGGISKDKVLQAFQPHIFFDDQELHCDPASRLVPTALVPNRLAHNDAIINEVTDSN